MEKVQLNQMNTPSKFTMVDVSFSIFLTLCGEENCVREQFLHGQFIFLFFTIYLF